MSQSRDFYIGLCLATGSSALIGSSFIVKKKALQALAVRAGTPIVVSVDFIHLNVGRLGFGGTVPFLPYVALNHEMSLCLVRIKTKIALNKLMRKI